MRRALILLSFAAGFIALPSSAEACSCMGSGPPCENAWNVPLVFAGKVTGIEATGADARFGPKRIRFAISEGFRGVDAKEVDIYQRGGSCDFEFVAGQEYLVYGHHRGDGPGWTTSICTRTRSLRTAAEDLAYLRLPDRDKGPSRVVGRVQHQVFDVSTSNYSSVLKPVKGVPVKATDGVFSSGTVTGDDGTYSIQVPWDRDIDVSFGPVGGLAVSGGRRVRIADPRACAGVDGRARYDGRISGTLVDSRGRPVPFFPLSLATSPVVHLGGFDHDVLTDAAGRFEFSGVNPATYLIAPSRRLWQRDPALAPLTSSPVAVAPAGRTDAGRLALPDTLVSTLIDGIVVDESDRPVSGADVTIRRPGTSHSLYGALVTDASGRFRVSVIAGQSYELEIAVRSYGWATNPPVVKTTITATGLEPIRLRLARSR